MTLIEQFTAEIAKYPMLAKMVDNVREDRDGDVFYEYDGFITCAVCYDGDYLDWGDVCESMVAAWKEGMESPEGRFYDTLEELVAQMAKDADPEVMA